MKVVIATPVDGALFWHALKRELTRLGHEVEIWSEVGDATYRRRPKSLVGVAVRFRILVLYALRVLWRGWANAHVDSAILLPTTPFFLPALGALVLRRRRCRVVQLLYDLYPDQLVLAGKICDGGLVHRAIAVMTRFALQRCDATVFLGRVLQMHAEHAYGRAKRGFVIEVGGDGVPFEGVVRRDRDWVSLLYAGNMGYAHDTNTLLSVIDDSIPDRVRLTFHASGAGYEQLVRHAKRKRCDGRLKLGGPLDDNEWIKVMRDADVGIITMKPGAERILFPSKTYSAMLAGQAILAICALDSDLGRTVRDSDCGWVIEPGESERLRKVLRSIADDRTELRRMQKNASVVGRSLFEMHAIAQKWGRLLADI